MIIFYVIYVKTSCTSIVCITWSCFSHKVQVVEEALEQRRVLISVWAKPKFQEQFLKFTVLSRDSGSVYRLRKRH